jgi:hypothetical protein
MESRIPVIEGQFGQITLISETARPQLQDVLDLAGDEPFAVCDFSFIDLEKAERTPWGYSYGRLVNIDHHGPDKDWERHVSSGNLAADYVRANGPVAAVIINHTDCDSILSSGIACGTLPPDAKYEAAVMAADHTGEENAIADLLQAIQDERDLEFSFTCLAALESGNELDERAMRLMQVRQAQRVRAAEAVAKQSWIEGRLLCLSLDSKIESELVAPLVRNAWAIAMVFPSEENEGRTELKLRLTSQAPIGFTLRRIDLSEVDPAYGGRWNAGSNKRGGQSLKPASQLLAEVAEQFKMAEQVWMLERALQIAAEAHAGQIDKGGQPYVTHPLRVMANVRTPIQKTVALLHDVVEDCEGWTFDRLIAEGFSSEVIEPLRLVTKRETDQLDDWDSYFGFIDRCARNPDAAAVKLADLEDNMDPSRISDPTEKDQDRLQKYSIARQRLMSLMGGINVPTPQRSGPREIGSMLSYSYPHQIDVEVLATETGMIETRSRLPVALKPGAKYRVRGSSRGFPTLPESFTMGAAVSLPFLPAGTKLYASVKAEGVPESHEQTTFNNDDQPVLRAVFHKKDPTLNDVTPAEGKEVFVELVLRSDLVIEVPAGRAGRLKDCDVLVPALEAEFSSLNQAYSAIARDFEPWRKSVAGNVFIKVSFAKEFTTKQGEVKNHLVWLDYLREQKELEALGSLLMPRGQLSLGLFDPWVAVNRDSGEVYVALTPEEGGPAKRLSSGKWIWGPEAFIRPEAEFTRVSDPKEAAILVQEARTAISSHSIR